MDGIVLDKITVVSKCVTYEFHTLGRIGRFFNTNKMFVEYNVNMEKVPESILAIPFVASLVPLMWLTDTVIWVKEIDKTFYHALRNIKAAYQDLYNHYMLKGNFVAARLVGNSFVPESESLLLYGGGMDANSTYIRIHDTAPVLCNIQGHYWQLTSKNPAAEADFRDIGAFAQREGRDFCPVKSNFARLVRSGVFDKEIKPKFHDSWWHGFQHSMAFISIAIPLAYLRKIRNIYIASSVPMGDYFMCASHVTTDSEFAFAGIGGCVHDGSELSRQDKAHIIVNYAKDIPGEYFLRVCSFNDHNCGVCDKCFRSMMDIVAEGGDLRHYGFPIQGHLKDYFEKLLTERIIFFNVKHEYEIYWTESQKRMRENYENIEEKDFVDWFLAFDFMAAYRKALWNYRIHNFGKLLVKKIKAFLRAHKK